MIAAIVALAVLCAALIGCLGWGFWMHLRAQADAAEERQELIEHFAKERVALTSSHRQECSALQQQHASLINRMDSERESLLQKMAEERSSLLDRIQRPEVRQMAPIEPVIHEPPKDLGELNWVGREVPDYAKVGTVDGDEPVPFRFGDTD